MNIVKSLFERHAPAPEVKRKVLISRLHLVIGAAGVLGGIFIISKKYVLGLLVGHVGIVALFTSLVLYIIGMHQRAMEIATDFLGF